MKKYMLAIMAIACLGAFTTTAKAEEVTTDSAVAVKTEAPADATKAVKDVKKVKHHAKKHHKAVKAEAKTEVKTEEAVKAPEGK